MDFLVVDDSKIARKRVCDYLNSLGHNIVAEAADGYEAIEKFKQFMPKVIAIDLEMPNMKGDEASKRILEINPNVDIILITSIVDKKEIVNAFNIGIKKVIKKPFKIQMIEKVINELKG